MSLIVCASIMGIELALIFTQRAHLCFFCVLFVQAWNPAAEDQCVDRCHRLGQSRDVVITKVQYLIYAMAGAQRNDSG